MQEWRPGSKCFEADCHRRPCRGQHVKLNDPFPWITSENLAQTPQGHVSSLFSIRRCRPRGLNRFFVGSPAFPTAIVAAVTTTFTAAAEAASAEAVVVLQLERIAHQFLQLGFLFGRQHF